MKPTSLCGGCTVCCRILEVPEVPGYDGSKPEHTACRWLHKPESGYSGCMIYKGRPAACQKFECHYIKLARRPDLDTPHLLRPDQSGVMLMHMPNRLFFTAHVFDPRRRDAWKEPIVFEAINNLVQEGFRVIITWGAGPNLLLERDGEGGILESTVPIETPQEPSDEVGTDTPS